MDVHGDRKRTNRRGEEGRQNKMKNAKKHEPRHNTSACCIALAAAVSVSASYRSEAKKTRRNTQSGSSHTPLFKRCHLRKMAASASAPYNTIVMCGQKRNARNQKITENNRTDRMAIYPSISPSRIGARPAFLRQDEKKKKKRKVLYSNASHTVQRTETREKMDKVPESIQTE